MKSVNIHISGKSIILAISLIALLWVLYVSKEVILILFASFILASALLPAVDWLSLRMRRGLAVSIVFLVGLIAILTILIPCVIVLSEQTVEFVKQLPAYTKFIETEFVKFKLISNYKSLMPNNADIINQTAGLSREIVNQSISFTINAFTWLITSFTLATIVLFILLDKKELKDLFLSFFPQEARSKAESIGITIAHRVGGYVRGELFIMATIAIVIALGLLILNVKFSLLLGLIAGLLELIPIVGPILATLLAALVALVQSPILALWVVILFVVVQRIQNSFLTPLIFGKMLDLSPILIIIALLFSATTLGVVGAILSPAIAAVVYVLIQELYLKKINKVEE
ncbi:MAG: AI-2E family transporter [bacterium]